VESKKILPRRYLEQEQNRNANLFGSVTFISRSNMDANGVPISSDQISNLRMRHLNLLVIEVMIEI
jgi:hypothetical protein